MAGYPTPYAGCEFRSRLEARAAVFFDAAEIEWQYEPEAIEMLYAPDQVIGFKAAPRSSPDAYAVRTTTKTAFQVEGRAFLKYYGIPEDRRGRRYRAELVDEGILAIDLNQDSEDG